MNLNHWNYHNIWLGDRFNCWDLQQICAMQFWWDSVWQKGSQYHWQCHGVNNWSWIYYWSWSCDYVGWHDNVEVGCEFMAHFIVGASGEDLGHIVLWLWKRSSFCIVALPMANNWLSPKVISNRQYAQVRRIKVEMFRPLFLSTKPVIATLKFPK
jgi:hypothetical protein